MVIAMTETLVIEVELLGILLDNNHMTYKVHVVFLVFVVMVFFAFEI